MYSALLVAQDEDNTDQYPRTPHVVSSLGIGCKGDKIRFSSWDRFSTSLEAHIASPRNRFSTN